MVWLVFTVLLGIAFWIAAAAAAFGPGMSATSPDSIGVKIPAVITMVVTGVLWLALTLFCSMHLLGTGQTALVYDFSGELKKGIKEEGMIWTAPWQHVKKENVFLQQELWVLDKLNSAVSKDQQAIYGEIALNFEVDPDTVVNLYRDVGPQWRDKLIEARVLQDFKEVTSTYSAQEITTQREKLRKQTADLLTEEFKPYSIRVIDFFVKNLGYSDDYEASISAKNVQVQKSLEAEARVREAEAEANQAAAKADGDRRSTRLKAEGEAAAIRLKGAALRANPEVLRLSAIEKLNPNAVIVFCSRGDCPTLLDQPTLKKAAAGG